MKGKQTMRQAIKAALLSGLVFPGLGQLLLKHYLRGAAFVVVGSGSMVLVVIRLTRQAARHLEQFAADGGPVDLGPLPGATDGLGGAWPLLLMIGCWILAVVDAYRLGRQKDLLAQAVFRIPKLP